MQRLNEKWLKYIHYYITLVVSVYLLIYVFFVIQQKALFVTNKDAFGASFSAALIAVFINVYIIFIRRKIRKYNVWLAYLIPVVSFAVFNTIIVEISLKSDTSPIFLLQNYIVVFFSTAFGFVAAFFAMVVVSIVYFISAVGSTGPTMFGPIGDGISVAIRIIICLLLLYLFRNKYEIEGADSRDYIDRFLVKNEVVKLLTNSISDGIIIVDQKGVVKSANFAVSQLFMRDVDTILGLKYSDIIQARSVHGAHISKADHPVSSVLKTKKPLTTELLLQQDGDEQKYIDMNVSPILNPQNDELYGAVINLRDISARKKEEMAKSEFISTASHEMRTPVATIEGYLALAMNPNVASIDDRAKDLLDKAHESTEHLGRLFQDLLISSRAEDGGLVNHPKVVELGGLIQKQVDNHQKSASDEGLELRFIIGADSSSFDSKEKNINPLYYINVDPDRINEVLSNLIENAIKYTDEGFVEVGLTGDSNTAQIYIKDSGIGITRSEISNLFQKFYRVDNSSTRTTGGTGLGLFICRKIVELYHGRIWIESEKGVGSTFYINLPRINEGATVNTELFATESEDLDETSVSTV